MEIIEALRFVQGAAKAPQHFTIADGRIESYNGAIGLSAPFNLGLECTPKADQLCAAISKCSDGVAVKLTPAGRLSVKSGPFKAFVACSDEPVPRVKFSAESTEIDGEAFLSSLADVVPFCATQSPQPWANGILVDGPTVYATDNFTLIQVWHGADIGYKFTLPLAAAKALLKADGFPCRVAVSETGIRFFYKNSGQWLHSTLIDHAWPDVSPLLDVPGLSPQPIKKDFFKALDALATFADPQDRVYCDGGKLKTSLIEGEGAEHDIDGISFEGCFNIKQLKRLQKIANALDFTTVDKKLFFFGSNQRGVCMGLNR